jgi:hypothetical protein
MNARQAHRWMAAALVDPELLARWRRQPESLRELGLSPGELDLDALWKFAGLSEKVRHSACRSHLPLTFRLMNRLGLEIDAFSEMAGRPAGQRPRGRLSMDERTEALADFLAGWLRPELDPHALVLDLLRHELAIARLRKLAADSSPGPAVTPAPGRRPAPLSARSVPAIQGELVLHTMSFDPRIVADRVRQDPAFDDLARGAVRLGYWWDGAAREPRLLDLDELGYGLLSLVDGAAAVGALAERLETEADLLLAPFSQLAELGLVRFEQAGLEEAGS